MKSKILVVDDEQDISRLIKINLEKAGYDVITLNNSKETLEKVKLEKPQAITLDIMMPEMDGFRVLKLLKNDPETKDIPVILVSVVSHQYKEQGLRLGVADFVNKPINFDTLCHIMEDIFSNKRVPADQKKKIMVIDDETNVTDIIKNVLRNKKFDVEIANNGAQAIELIKKEKYDLIILDLYMPGMDGFEVLQKIKTDEETADIPVIILTAHDLKGYREKCLFLGANQYLTKPFSVETLVSEISECLQQITK